MKILLTCLILLTLAADIPQRGVSGTPGRFQIVPVAVNWVAGPLVQTAIRIDTVTGDSWILQCTVGAEQSSRAWVPILEPPSKLR